MNGHNARARVNAWGAVVGYCPDCTETASGSMTAIQRWVDMHRHATDPEGLALVQAILDRKAAASLHDHRDGASCHTCTTYNRD